MKLLLTRRGRSVVATASTLAEARQCLAADLPTHVILDQNLPDGLGTDLLREMQAQGLLTRVMLLSGAADPMLSDQAKRLGAEGLMTKPPDWERLVEWTATPAAGA